MSKSFNVWLMVVGLGACTGRMDAPLGGAESDDAAPTPAPSPGGGQETTNLGELPLGDRCETPTVGRARLWRLSREQLARTIEHALGVTPTAAQLGAFQDGAGLLFRNEAATLTVRKGDATSWASSAAELAAASAPRLATSCPDPAALACGRMLVDAIAPRLFRRPLSTEERDRYVALFGKVSERPAEAVVSAMLQSPFFLYRSELGRPVAGRPGVARLTGYEVASALSYTLWQSPPDEELLRAAAAGELDGATGVRKQASRLIADARFDGFFASFLADLTHGAKMATRDGADSVADGARLMGLLADELATFVRDVMAEEPTLAGLLSRRRIRMDAALARHRNLSTSSGSGAADVELPGPVAGLLALGAVSFANAGVDHPSPVRRGLMVRESFLCAPVPPPPPSVQQDFVQRGDLVTNRQRYEATMAPAACDECHRLFNPIGYAFEALDELGRYRTQDGGRDVDLTGHIVDTFDADGAFDDLTGLAAALARSKQVSQCVALQGFRFVSGRFEDQGDLCYVTRIHDAFERDGRNLETLALELVTSDAFVYRTVEN